MPGVFGQLSRIKTSVSCCLSGRPHLAAADCLASVATFATVVGFESTKESLWPTKHSLLFQNLIVRDPLGLELRGNMPGIGSPLGLLLFLCDCP